MDSMFKHVWLDFNDAEVRTSVLFNRPCCVMNFNCLRLMFEGTGQLELNLGLLWL